MEKDINLKVKAQGPVAQWVLKVLRGTKVIPEIMGILLFEALITGLTLIKKAIQDENKQYIDGKITDAYTKAKADIEELIENGKW